MSVFIGMMMKRGEQSIVEEGMFVGSRSDIELDMRTSPRMRSRKSAGIHRGCWAVDDEVFMQDP